ncbi:MAG: hypothetical protein COA78_34490 [Blastopirellula sp.]|nr:MAG: hypothetical protein COA78_34490 [Blastopirellula sp.]
MTEIWKMNATRLGEKLAKEQEFTSLPVDPKQIAHTLGIVIEPLPSDRTSVSGMLVYVKNENTGNDIFGIKYATYIDNPGFQNFSISHELGHYHIPGHPQALLGNGYHESRAGFITDDRYELEADHFAAGLLMPGYLFDKALNEVQSGLAAIEKLSNQCETSLTSTAIRYAQRSPDPVAIIVSEGPITLYCFMSDELRELKELNWIKKNTPLPRNSHTFAFNQSEKNVASGARVDGAATLSDWFSCDLNYEVYEEVIGLGGYGKTLTVLSVEELPEQEDIDEEDELIDSWKPKFKR